MKKTPVLDQREKLEQPGQEKQDPPTERCLLKKQNRPKKPNLREKLNLRRKLCLQEQLELRGLEKQGQISELNNLLKVSQFFLKVTRIMFYCENHHLALRNSSCTVT